MANDNHDEAHLRNLMRFVHAQDSGGLYDGTGTYAEAVLHRRGTFRHLYALHPWTWYVAQ